jgi:hypothetical protein
MFLPFNVGVIIFRIEAALYNNRYRIYVEDLGGESPMDAK